MRHSLVTCALVALLAREAVARPPADAIVVWAPGHDVAPLADVARELGVALVDRSPPLAKAPDTDARIARAIDAYEALQLDTAWTELETARRELDATGGAGVTTARLSDLFVYRSLLRAQRGEVDGAWEELVAATVVAPARVFDPARFPPRTLAELERARKLVAGSLVAFAIEASTECAVTVDGAPSSRDVTLARGSHWIHARCPGRAPWGRRVDVSEGVARVRVDAAPLVPPTATDLLVQARAAGTRGIVVVEVHGTVAHARVLGLDGVERDRRTASIQRSLAPASGLVRALLAPRPESRWYRSRWVWAAGGALAVALVLIPVMVIAADDPPTGVRVTGPGELPP